jgi:putative membrane-bound dehydrogenase-like protein
MPIFRQSSWTTRGTRWALVALLSAGSSAFFMGEQDAQRSNRRGQRDDGPLSPDDALARFEIESGYRIELAAAEPLIEAPVAIAFDDRGRMYVVESRGYPGPLEGSPGPAPRHGVIALLEDTNADGRFDRRTDFARDLTFPNGIMPWDGGVFVSCAPDLLYLKDTNGDGIADQRRVVLTGFDDTRTAQIRFSHPTLGIDNWLYMTSGLTGGRVTVPDHPDRPPVILGTSDSRFNPVTEAFEPTGGRGQYGLTFDDYGRRFVCSNRRPVMHVVLESRYLKRNPHLSFSETVQDVSASGAQAPVFPTSGDTTTASFIPGLMSAPHAGTFTAASGVHIHRGDALPAQRRDSIFICESAQNLVQRQILSADGVTFTSRPAQTGRDFLTSRDTWFRPVFAANGPDGALYIVDMYRKIIDHPQYVPEQSRPLLDFEAGKQRGRIYRVVARDWKAERTRIDLGRMSASALARTLEHPNAWWRETAQRLLVERRDWRAIPSLRTIAGESRSEVSRIHALWTLDSLGGLETADVVRALEESHPAVRENAARLAESRVAGSSQILSRLLRLAHDADDRVRLRVALALGETNDSLAIDALAAIARHDGAVPWMRAAILSSVRERSNDFLRAFVAAPSSSPGVKAAVMQDLGQLFGAGESPERCLDLILEISEPGAEFGWQPAALSGIAQGLSARGLGRNSRSAFMTLVSSDSPQAREARDRVEIVLAQSSALALDANAPADQRLAAIRLLSHTDHSLAGKTLESLLAPSSQSEIQIAAVRALAQLPEPAGAATLVEPRRWQAFTPQVRDAVVTVLMTGVRQTLVLLDALEKGNITATELGASRRNRIMSHPNPEIQRRARALFAGVESGDRMQVYERVRGLVLTRAANAANGKPVFRTHCAACHMVDGAGGQLGPDLSGIRNQPADAILLHVLVPDYEIAAGYQAYAVEIRDGRTMIGRLESEAPNSLTLRDGSSQQHVILRIDVVSISASTRSLMPSDLERAMSEQELADLIGYLKASPRP